MIKTYTTDVLDNVFIFYDFKQVDDAMMIVAFVEQLGRWEKIFVYKFDDQWETKSLRTYFGDKKVDWICNKLKIIIQHRENSNQFDGIEMDNAIKNKINLSLPEM